MNNPWLPYIVTDYIKRLKPKSVFEWGSGSSTLFWVELGTSYIVSIEHDEEWWRKVSNKIKVTLPYQKIENNLIYIQDGSIGNDPANPHYYKSGSTQLGDVNFKNYVTTIDHYHLFDLILIDGMARASCLYHAFNHVNPGGCIVLDNTGDRPYYLEQTVHLFGNYEDGWERIDMMGYGPILDYKWQTTIFINKRKQDYE